MNICGKDRDPGASLNPGAEVFQTPAKATLCTGKVHQSVLLQTARATVFNTNKPKRRAEANETGSQQSYITTG